VSLHKTQKPPHKEEFFTAVFQVIKADETAIANGWNPQWQEGAWQLNTDWEGWLSDVKGFLVALMGVDESEVSEDLAEKVISEDQPATGIPVNLEVWEKPTNSGGVFSVHQWTQFVPAATPAPKA
jgi:hypothetical protein